MPGAAGPSAAIESIAVGAFGACLGGEAVAGMLRGGGKAVGFTVGGLALAVTGALVMLLMLKVMRSAVGPIGARKKKGRR
jgi:hypothetical protein